MQIQKILSKLRDMGYTRRELSTIVGVSENTLYRWEMQEPKRVDIAGLEKLQKLMEKKK